MSWNGFKGAAKRIEDVDLPRIGHRIGVGEDVIHAVIDVESRGYGFDKQGRPIILFERHWFYRLLKKYNPEKLQGAKDVGLAVSKWSRATYNKDQYSLLKRAIEIDEHCALMSASWGLGQVMGFNYEAAGFDGVFDFVQAMMDDEDNHLEAMIEFIVNKGLDDELRALEKAKTRAAKLRAAGAFAHGYNGSGYKANKYDTRIVAAFDKWQGIKDTPWNPDDAVAEDADNGIALPDVPVPTPRPEPEPVPVDPDFEREIERQIAVDEIETQAKKVEKPGLKSKVNWLSTALTAFTTAVTATSEFFAKLDTPVQIAIIVAVVGTGLFIIVDRQSKSGIARDILSALKGVK
jgi:hypothetical protein